jgi:hypothetical protein
MPGMSQPARKRRGPITLFFESRRFRWAIALLVLLPVLYVASFGPASWLARNDIVSLELAWRVYRPLAPVIARCPERLRREITTHVDLAELMTGFGEDGMDKLLEMKRQIRETGTHDERLLDEILNRRSRHSAEIKPDERAP